MYTVARAAHFLLVLTLSYSFIITITIRSISDGCFGRWFPYLQHILWFDQFHYQASFRAGRLGGGLLPDARHYRGDEEGLRVSVCVRGAKCCITTVL